MRLQQSGSLTPVGFSPAGGPIQRVLTIGLFLVSILLPAAAQEAFSTRPGEDAGVRSLANHHPLWAKAENDRGRLPDDQTLAPLTLVLARSAERQAALEQLLAEQQDPASPEYHRWLSPAELGSRFGVSDGQLEQISNWLESQGLNRIAVSSSRIFVTFSGTAGQAGRAFQTEFHTYTVHGAERISVSSDPMLPAAVAPLVSAVRGLYTIEERPFHEMGSMTSDAPEVTFNSSHYLAPADFDLIYDVPSSLTGSGQTIGIVGRARTYLADFQNFSARTGFYFSTRKEVVPTTYGGVDPGPAYTAPPGSGVDIGDQGEATLDVLRTGSVAPSANLLLVVATNASGGIATDAEYLVDTNPIPAQVMSISFGACELEGGSSGVAYWDKLFEQGAAEGISTFVSSGDSGASGCDTSFQTPPTSPEPNSPNYICSSSYATCVGGTEFADSSNPSLYWSSSNGTGLSSALRYIPEGGWNEPLDSSSQPQVASSGGGVSKVIPTPGWQAGVGVPSARSGRYTPDVAFSASLHDGYFACFAAAGETCALSGSSYGFEYFAGTSAAAPSMAGVAALLNQKRGAAQGNLNPTLYATFAASPALFHDVTVSTSGVSSCSVSTPSMCNNSIPSAAALSGGQAGFLVGTGYDEVTGLGSLDVGAFLGGSSTTITPTVTVTPSATTIATSQAITVAVVVTAGSSNPTPTGLVSLTGGGYTSSPTTLSAGAANFSIPAGALNGGTDALTAVYTPDSASAKTYSGADGSATVTVTAPPPFLITGSSLTVTPGATSGNTATITITPSGGFTGTVYLSANLTSFPAGVTTLPLISLGSTTPVTITGTSAVTATLTVTTSAASAGGCTAANQGPPTAPWVPGSAVLAGLLLLGVPVRRRGWRALVGMLVLLAALATGATACNTSQTTSNCSSSGSNGAATSAGTYTVTINGASGVTFESGTINLTVQ